MDWHWPLRVQPIYVRLRVTCKSRIDPDSYLHGRDNWSPVKRVVRYDESFVAELQEFVAVREHSPPLWLELTARSNTEALGHAQIIRLKSPCPAGRGHCMKASKLVSILTDLHLWVPVVVLILGIALLMSLKVSQ
jgi:hypothetical protein